MTKIHPSAIVSSKARIHESVEIGPYSIIEDDVEIQEGTILKNAVVLANGARIGKNVKIFSGAVISAVPQDLKYKGEETLTEIGDDTVVREYATINRGTVAEGKTVVGKNCLLMSYTHVAHDCILGDNIIMSNATQLGGHVLVEDWVILGGVTKVHQFVHIGKHAMIGADTKLVKDVPPFTLIGREPAKVQGINKVGLRRRGFSDNEIKEIDDFYYELMFSGDNTSEAIKKFESSENSENVNYCVDFIKNSKRGIYR